MLKRLSISCLGDKLIQQKMGILYSTLIWENDMSKIINQGDQAIIRPGTDVVASMTEAFKGELSAAIGESNGLFAIDLKGVEMIDSVGLGVVIAAYNTLSQAGRQLKLFNLNKELYAFFTNMRLHLRFDVEGAV